MQSLEDGNDDEIGGKREAELIVQTINLCSGGDGYVQEQQLLSNPKYQKLMDITCGICYQIRQFQLMKNSEERYKDGTADMAGMTNINSGMQELMKLVFSSEEEDLDGKIKEIFLLVAKSYYYAAYCNPETINFHVKKVLFEGVV